MDTTISEAEFYNIVMLYADSVANHIEFFIGATLAMIMAIFVVGNKLNLALRLLSIVTYGGFAINLSIMIYRIRARIGDVKESISLITSDQADRAPLIDSFLRSRINPEIIAGFATDQLLMILVALCCCILMAKPNLMKSGETK